MSSAGEGIGCKPIADLWLPSGKVVACEPDQIEETPPFDVRLPAGRFPVFLRIAQLDTPDREERVAAAIIRFAEWDVVQWEPASNGRTSSDDSGGFDRALDWLLERQQSIENALAKRHLSEGSLVLYDVSSTYFEGRHCPLARFGHSRDERGGNPQNGVGIAPPD